MVEAEKLQPNRQEAVFFAAIEAARMAMIVTDPHQPDHPIVFANQAFADLTGYPVNEVLGRNCRFLQGPETDPLAIQQIREALLARTNLAVELRNYRRDGTPFWNALFISPVFDRSGRLLYFFGSQLDVTRRREAESALHQAQKLQAVGELTGGVAHDFNNLLMVLAAGIETLSQHAPEGRPQRHVERMQEAVTRARRLTAQLLAFASRQQLERRLVDLNALVRDFLDIAQHSLGQRLSLRIENAPEPLYARLDVTQVQAALVALLANARDAMPEQGQVTVRLTTVVRDGLPFAVLEVADNGQGMPPEVLARATEPFFTTRTSRAGQAGLGLGLAGVYGLMRQLQGRLELQSEPGQGTVARLLFPLEPPPDVVPRHGRETLLLVDDDPLVREAATEMLESLGYRVLTAGSGAEALAALETEPEVALLLTDVVMPGMNGVALAEEAKRRRPALKVLLATGQAQVARLVSSAGGMQGELPLLPKPFRPALLAAQVRHALDE